jgi:hypothetical protein
MSGPGARAKGRCGVCLGNETWGNFGYCLMQLGLWWGCGQVMTEPTYEITFAYGAEIYDNNHALYPPPRVSGPGQRVGVK